MSYAATLQDVEAAAGRLKGRAHVTPVLTCTALDSRAGRALHLKAEVFQKGGAFKFRGAFNAVAALPADARDRGVVTHSSGNHAGALALAAKLAGVPAHIVVPRGAPACKLAAIVEYGGKIYECEPNVAAREARCAEVQAETGATLVPPYNYGPVIAGQGTISLEFLRQVPELDAVVVPVSGGGMLSGIALAAKALKPSIKVLAAEPVGRSGDRADCAASLAAGELVKLTEPDTIADGLRAKLGDLTWAIIKDHVDGVVTVAEDEIVDAMQLVFERVKVVVEPSGAVGVAAALSEGFKSNPEYNGLKNVGVILCGGNLDLAPLFGGLRARVSGS